MIPKTVEEVLADLVPEDREQWLEGARVAGWCPADVRRALREAEKLARGERTFTPRRPKIYRQR